MPTPDSEKWPLSASPNFSWRGSIPKSWRFCANNALKTMPTPELSMTCPRLLPKIARSHDRPNHLALSHRRETGRRWDGSGVQRKAAEEKSAKPQTRYLKLTVILSKLM
jgi:hypothetical protein